MRRKLIVALLCTGMMLGLAGCGDGSNENVDTESGNSSDTVTLLSWYTEEQMMPLKEGFENANPGLELEVQFVPPTEQYIQKLTLLMNGNEPTDLFFMCPEVREDVVATDFAEDLSDMPIMEGMSDNAKRTLGADGKVYGLSMDSWASFIFYNKEIFKQAGIEKTPETWDELIEDMAKIKELGIDPMTAQSEDAGRLLLGLFASNEASKDPSVEIASLNAASHTTSRHPTSCVASPALISVESLSYIPVSGLYGSGTDNHDTAVSSAAEASPFE